MYLETLPNLWFCNCFTLKFHIYEENLIFLSVCLPLSLSLRQLLLLIYFTVRFLKDCSLSINYRRLRFNSTNTVHFIRLYTRSILVHVKSMWPSIFIKVRMCVAPVVCSTVFFFMSNYSKFAGAIHVLVSVQQVLYYTVLLQTTCTQRNLSRRCNIYHNKRDSSRWLFHFSLRLR